MSVLVDTSVWSAHFRSYSSALVHLIAHDQALTHPMILLELACGTPLAPRQQTLHDLGLLRQSTQVSLHEVAALIAREKLYGLGCGLVDMVLLGSTLLTPDASLWTLDKHLASLARRFAVLHPAAELH